MKNSLDNTASSNNQASRKVSTDINKVTPINANFDLIEVDEDNDTILREAENNLFSTNTVDDFLALHNISMRI